MTGGRHLFLSDAQAGLHRAPKHGGQRQARKAGSAARQQRYEMMEGVTETLVPSAPPVMPSRDLWPCVAVHRSTDPAVPAEQRFLAWQVDENGAASPLPASSMFYVQSQGEPALMTINGWALVLRGEYRVDGALQLQVCDDPEETARLRGRLARAEAHAAEMEARYDRLILDTVRQTETADETAADPRPWLPYPPGEDQALAFARKAPWRFESYYKYEFTFTVSGMLIAPDTYKGPREFTATATTGGDSANIYRYDVTPSMTWDEISQAGTPSLVVKDSGGTELVRVNGD